MSGGRPGSGPGSWSGRGGRLSAPGYFLETISRCVYSVGKLPHGAPTGAELPPGAPTGAELPPAGLPTGAELPPGAPTGADPPPEAPGERPGPGQRDRRRPARTGGPSGGPHLGHRATPGRRRGGAPRRDGGARRRRGAPQLRRARTRGRPLRQGFRGCGVRHWDRPARPTLRGGSSGRRPAAPPCHRDSGTPIRTRGRRLP